MMAKTVMVVDDAQFMRMRVSKLLAKHGYDVVEAEDGDAAQRRVVGLAGNPRVRCQGQSDYADRPGPTVDGAGSDEGRGQRFFGQAL